MRSEPFNFWLFFLSLSPIYDDSDSGAILGEVTDSGYLEMIEPDWRHAFASQKLNQLGTTVILKDNRPIQMINQSRDIVAHSHAKCEEVNCFGNPKNEGGIGLSIGYV